MRCTIWDRKPRTTWYSRLGGTPEMVTAIKKMAIFIEISLKNQIGSIGAKMINVKIPAHLPIFDRVSGWCRPQLGRLVWMVVFCAVPLYGAEQAPVPAVPAAPATTPPKAPLVIIPELPDVVLPALSSLPPAVQARLQDQADAAAAVALAKARQRTVPVPGAALGEKIKPLTAPPNGGDPPGPPTPPDGPGVTGNTSP